MKHLLVIEDQPADLRIATEAAHALGIASVEGCRSTGPAVDLLNSALRGERSLPDAILLDLDLGYESGFELLRFWHSNPSLNTIPVVIWTVLDGDFGELCRLFKVSAVIPKWQGPEALRNALGELKAAV